MKNKMITLLAITTVAGVSLGQTSLAATTYGGALSGQSTVEAEITVPDKIVIPPVDPSEPEPEIEDKDINPEQGDGLAIRYISSLDFGTTQFSQENQTLTANPDSGADQLDTFENMVVVQDLRSNRTGWELRVAQSSELFNGAILTMNPHADNQTLTNLGVTVSSLVELNTASNVFATADNAEAEAGIISIGMGEVELFIPGGTGVGQYETTLDWTLIAGV